MSTVMVILTVVTGIVGVVCVIFLSLRIKEGDSLRATLALISYILFLSLILIGMYLSNKIELLEVL